MPQNKKKIFNDPVYGFVGIPHEIIFDLIEHPWFQRLRRITQLGLTHYVYPGALHTRFSHALGANHLMSLAIEVLRSKGHDISEEESEAANIGILLHDIGHGPYSHTLEHHLIEGVSHEQLSSLYMAKLNEQFGGALDLAIEIFHKKYHKKYLQQLISGQLDVDRMDYLKRDSFFTGVHEGVISYDRILKMLSVSDGDLVVESKGIYSIEKFIIARRLMYWQVYLHKTVLGAEELLIRILQRARYLTQNGENLPASRALAFFLKGGITFEEFKKGDEALEMFSAIDDYDILWAIKQWSSCDDKVLSILSSSLINRRLFNIEFRKEPLDEYRVDAFRKQVQSKYGLSYEESKYFVYSGSTSNRAYNPGDEQIKILFKDGTVKDIAEASDQLNISVLSHPVTKYFISFPKGL